MFTGSGRRRPSATTVFLIRPLSALTGQGVVGPASCDFSVVRVGVGGGEKHEFEFLPATSPT